MTRTAIHIELPYGFSFDEVVRIAQAAESAGYETLWASDHLIGDAQDPQRPCFEVWTLLTALAPLTTCLRLGSLVTCYAFRHPGMLARTVACLDAISNGRIDCAVGAGWNEAECRAYGIPFPDISTRMDQLEESVRILKQLWTRERVNFNGGHYTLENAVCAPKPVQEPLPLWIGGQGERRLLRLVAQEANGWNMVMGRTVAEVQHKFEVLQRHCDDIGRDIATIDKSLFVLTYLYDTESEFKRLRDDLVNKLGPDIAVALERARTLGLGGSAAQVTATLEQYRALGFDYFVALFPYSHEQTLLQRYAEEIWPHLA